MKLYSSSLLLLSSLRELLRGLVEHCMMYELTAWELYKRWGEGKTFNADVVYYWHSDSEVMALEELATGAFDIYYADGTIDTIGRYTVILVQLYNYGETSD